MMKQEELKKELEAHSNIVIPDAKCWLEVKTK
jgi:hypothetical protein